MELMMLLSPAAGLGRLVNNIINDWIGPILIGLIAAIAIILLFKRQFAGFLTFAVMAILAAVFVFFGDALFGKSGNLSNQGKNLSQKINAVDLTKTTFSEDFVTDLR